MTKDDIAFVTESAATNKSFLKLRFPHEALALVLELDVLGEPIKKIFSSIFPILTNVLFL